MFGVYRTLLALMVVIDHLSNLPVAGYYAVSGFFILSGYLMTYIMHHSYGYTQTGRLNFTLNRFLRLYPAYWAILLLSVFMVLYFGESNSTAYRKAIFLPSNFMESFQNIFFLYFDWMPGSESPRLSPPTWALTVELLYYLLIALGISKSKTATNIWVMAGLCYFGGTHILSYGFPFRYSNILAGSLPFSIGALVYHHRKILTEKIGNHPKSLNFTTLFVLFLLNSICAHFASKYNWQLLENVSIYLNYVINAIIIIYLIKGKVPFITEKWDKIIGAYSYPIYLFHMQAGFIISMMIWGQPIVKGKYNDLIITALAILLTLFVSFLVIKLIDRPIDKYRKKIKERIIVETL